MCYPAYRRGLVSVGVVGLMLSALLITYWVSEEQWVSGQAPAAAAGVTLARDIQPIFDSYCVYCHMTGAAQGGLSLEPGASYSNLVNAASSESPLLRVEPGAPERSYLLHKLEGTHLRVGGKGERMPLGGGPLPANEIALIRQWIAQGAPEK